MIRFTLAIWLSAATVCLAQEPSVVDYCTIQDTKNAPSQVYDFVSELAALVPFNGQNYWVLETRAELVRQRKAVAVLCAGYQNWILYDPDWMAASIKRAQSDLPRKLALAHEIAHHVAGDTSDQSAWDGGLWGTDKERIADRTAGTWLARLKVPEQDVLRAFDALDLPELGPGYPSLIERRKAVLEGYRAGVSVTTTDNGAGVVHITASESDARAVLRDLSGVWKESLHGAAIRVTRKGHGYVATLITGDPLPTGASSGNLVFTLDQSLGTLTLHGHLSQYWSYDWEATLFYYRGGRCNGLGAPHLNAEVQAGPMGDGRWGRYIHFSVVPNYDISYNFDKKRCEMTELPSHGVDLLLAQEDLALHR